MKILDLVTSGAATSANNCPRGPTAHARLQRGSTAHVQTLFSVQKKP